jgi:hypothetical protein
MLDLRPGLLRPGPGNFTAHVEAGRPAPTNWCRVAAGAAPWQEESQ